MGVFERKVKDFINQHHLITKNARLLVGVSGGPDSLALLHFFIRIQQEYQLSLYVAHVDHMFRGRQSYDDLKYVETLCKNWNIPFEGKQINVPKELARRSESSQAISRELRYDFFQFVMEKHQIPTLALAHHGDDQIETILMRLTRGSSTASAAGIRTKRPFGNGEIIRPFLCMTKEEIEDYIRRNNLKPVYDPSNEMDTYTRNRFRKYVLPFLKQENGKVHEHFQRFSEDTFEDEKLLLDLAKEQLHKLIIIQNTGDITFNINEFLQISMPLQRRCIHLILNYLYKGNSEIQISAIHIHAIIDLLNNNRPSGRVDLPNGLQITISYNNCLFSFSKLRQEPFEIEWNMGDTIHLPDGSQLLMGQYDHSVPAKEFFLLNSNTSFPLIVRTRKHGDRIQQKGTGGTKKLKALFIDEKIPLHKRDEWPIVTDQEGNIIWVPLLKKSIYEATNEQDAIVLQYKEDSSIGEP